MGIFHVSSIFRLGLLTGSVVFDVWGSGFAASHRCETALPALKPIIGLDTSDVHAK